MASKAELETENELLKKQIEDLKTRVNEDPALTDLRKKHSDKLLEENFSFREENKKLIDEILALRQDLDVAEQENDLLKQTTSAKMAGEIKTAREIWDMVRNNQIAHDKVVLIPQD